MAKISKLRKILLSLLFPEYYQILRELKQADKNTMFIVDILKRHDNILRSEVWEQISKKYEVNKE